MKTLDLVRHGALALVLTLGTGASLAEPVDLSDQRQLLDAFVKTTGSLDGEEVVIYAQSTVYAFVPGSRGQALFDLEVIGVKRYERIEGGWQRIQREIALYTDRETGEVLAHWDNPWTGERVRVIPVLNDPVNRRHVIDGQGGGWGIGVMESGDEVMFYREIPLRYPNPLSPQDHPRHSSGEWYEAMELFNHFVRRSDLENPALASAPSTVSWSRIGPWLPWMAMADHPGWLVYHGRGVKLDSVAGLPAHIHDYIERHHPQYLSAPEAWSEPSETSWTFFRKLLEGEIDLDDLRDH
ncbi:MAG: DUF1838 family protein [Gammaproteobacteria bacterium]|nr:DUF1838 family protein [Gammaproteobacteria bacterium]